MIKAEFYKDKTRVGILEITPHGDCEYRQTCGTCSCKSPIFCGECNDFAEKMKVYFLRPLDDKSKTATLQREMWHLAPHQEKKKEVTTMQVSYNGTTGELLDLKAIDIPVFGGARKSYHLSIYDSEKDATISFNDIKLEDVKFLGGKVTFGG